LTKAHEKGAQLCLRTDGGGLDLVFPARTLVAATLVPAKVNGRKGGVGGRGLRDRKTDMGDRKERARERGGGGE
jgi:hypothetical protein